MTFSPRPRWFCTSSSATRCSSPGTGVSATAGAAGASYSCRYLWLLAARLAASQMPPAQPCQDGVPSRLPRATGVECHPRVAQAAQRSGAGRPRCARRQGRTRAGGTRAGGTRRGGRAGRAALWRSVRATRGDCAVGTSHVFVWSSAMLRLALAALRRTRKPGPGPPTPTQQRPERTLRALEPRGRVASGR
jgi:hypothetical protein